MWLCVCVFQFLSVASTEQTRPLGYVFALSAIIMHANEVHKHGKLTFSMTSNGSMREIHSWRVGGRMGQVLWSEHRLGPNGTEIGHRLLCSDTEDH